MFNLISFAIFGLAGYFNWLFWVVSILFSIKIATILIVVYDYLIHKKEFLINFKLECVLWSAIAVLYAMMVQFKVSLNLIIYFLILIFLVISTLLKFNHSFEYNSRISLPSRLHHFFMGVLIYRFYIDSQYVLILVGLVLLLWFILYYYFKPIMALNLKAKIYVLFFIVIMLLGPTIKPYLQDSFTEILQFVSLLIVIMTPNIKTKQY